MKSIENMCRGVGYEKWRKFVDRYPGCGICHSHVILAQEISTPLKGLPLQRAFSSFWRM